MSEYWVGGCTRSGDGGVQRLDAVTSVATVLVATERSGTITAVPFPSDGPPGTAVEIGAVPAPVFLLAVDAGAAG